jgi:hypothetical protein
MKVNSQISRNGLFQCFLASVFLCVVSAVGNTATLRVSPNGDGTNGESWSTAFTSVGDAIAASASGDEIWVASGTYNEAITLTPGISLYGGFAGDETDQDFSQRDWKRHETILDATGLETTVLVGATGTIVDGFTVTHGKVWFGFGGGISCRNVSMTI